MPNTRDPEVTHDVLALARGTINDVLKNPGELIGLLGG